MFRLDELGSSSSSILNSAMILLPLYVICLRDNPHSAFIKHVFNVVKIIRRREKIGGTEIFRMATDFWSYLAVR